MTAGIRRSASLMVVAAAGALLAGCATGPTPLDSTQVEQVMHAIDISGQEGATVGDTLALAPEGTIGMIDARVAAGVGQTQETIEGTPLEGYHDWIVVGLCGYPAAIPAIELAAVPAADAPAVLDGQGFHLDCDGPAALLAE